MILKLLRFTCLLPLTVQAHAPVAPIPIELTQPNGYTFTAIPKGEINHQWVETADGYTIVKKNNTWYYAEKDITGNLVSSRIHIAKNTSAPFAKHLKPSIDMGAELAPKNPESITTKGAIQEHDYPHYSESFSTQITQPTLVLLLSFPETPFLYDESSFQKLVFGSESSIAKFYSDASYGKLNISPVTETSGTANDGVISINMTNSHPDFGDTYGEQSQTLISSAFSAADSYINFKEYDKNNDNILSPQELAIIFIVAGYEHSYGGLLSLEPRVWAHKSTMPDSLRLDEVQFTKYAMFGERHGDHQATIGIMCHEVGHLLYELPDLYDRTPNTQGVRSHGVGRWGLMGNGSWNSHDGHAGNSPADFLAWSKLRMGFSQAEDLDTSFSNKMLSPSTETDKVFRLWLDPYKRHEHFLLENRQSQGFDQGLPGTGLLITHIDPDVGIGAEGTQNDNPNHKLVDIEEADGLLHLDDNTSNGDVGDTFPGSQQKSAFSALTTPSILSYEGFGSHLELYNINQAGINVSFGLNAEGAEQGGNIGFDEKGPNGIWGYNQSYIETAIAFKNTSSFDFIDGVDIHVNSTSSVVITLYESMSADKQLNKELYAQDFTVKPGWNRILFNSPQPFKEQVYLSAKIEANNSDHPVSIDALGINSNNAFSRSSSDIPFQELKYDLSQRLLLSYSQSPIDLDALKNIDLLNNITQIDTSTTVNDEIKTEIVSDNTFNNTPQKSSASSGGGAFSLWGITLFMLLTYTLRNRFSTIRPDK